MLNLVMALFVLLIWAGNVTADETGTPILARHVNPLESQQGRIYTLPQIRMTDVAVVDHDLLTPEEIDRVVRPFRGKEVSFEELEQIRHELTRIIIGKGYINTGVIIPDQEVENGVVRFEVIQGKLTSVVLEGSRHFSSRYLKSKLQRGTLPTLNISTLQENLQLLQLNPNIKRINAEFVPGERPGESVLKAHIEERRPYALRLETANSNPPSTGAYRGDITASYSNLLGTGDVIEGRFGVTEGNLDYGARIAVPVNSVDTTLEAYFRRGENTVVEEGFSDLDIESVDNTYGIRISQPFVIDLTHQFGLSLAAEYRTSTTSILGRNFSFSEGAEEGKSKVSVIRFGQEYLNRDLDHVFALNSTLSFGLDAMHATRHTDGQPDGRFFSWLAQLLYIYQMEKAQLLFRADAQLSNDPLLAMEKFSVGGINSVRGYRRSLFVRDNGVSGTLESRIPLYLTLKGEPLLSLIPFYDFGYSWNHSNATVQTEDFIHGVGAGVRWSPLKGVIADFFYGYALREIEVSDHDRQDDGIHFNLSWQIL